MMIPIITMSEQNSYFIFFICSSVTWLHMDMKSISSPKELSEIKETLLLLLIAAGIGYGLCYNGR
jgi:hypothetical protein